MVRLFIRIKLLLGATAWEVIETQQKLQPSPSFGLISSGQNVLIPKDVESGSKIWERLVSKLGCLDNSNHVQFTSQFFFVVGRPKPILRHLGRLGWQSHLKSQASLWVMSFPKHQKRKSWRRMVSQAFDFQGPTEHVNARVKLQRTPKSPNTMPLQLNDSEQAL